MSIEWVPLVHSLPCPFRTTCQVATALNLMYDGGDSGEYGQTIGICRIQTACDHSTGFMRFRTDDPVSLHGWSARSHTGQT